MSFEKDITEIKKMVEAEEPVFKAASPEQVAKRVDDIVAQQAQQLYAKAEEARPGIIAELRAKLGNSEALVQTAIAYADTQHIDTLLGIEPEEIRMADLTSWNDSLGAKIRDLDWPGVWTDKNTFLKQAEMVGGYNVFDEDIAKGLVQDFGDRQYRLAREGSVAVYIRPVKKVEMGLLKGSEGPNAFGEDEHDLDGNELRLWWD